MCFSSNFTAVVVLEGLGVFEFEKVGWVKISESDFSDSFIEFAMHSGPKRLNSGGSKITKILVFENQN